MSWLKIDDGFHEHPKISALTNAGYRLYHGSLCYAARRATDGFVPRSALKPLGGSPAASAELVEAGLWHASAAAGVAGCERCAAGAIGARWCGYAGWVIHDFLEYNPSARDQDRRRNDARDRMADLRQGRGAHRPRASDPAVIDSSQHVRANISEVRRNISDVR